jgi:hypothetical protein
MISQISQADWGEQVDLETVCQLAINWEAVQDKFNISFETDFKDWGQLKHSSGGDCREQKYAYIEINGIKFILWENPRSDTNGVSAIISTNEPRAAEALELILDAFDTKQGECKFIHEFYINQRNDS